MNSPYGVYRQVRAQRTWRPLGKMSWWRIVLGSALLLSVFLISGFVSQRLAGAGHFRAAERLMIAPGWVETYRPELKAFIEAGVLFEDGAYGQARDAFAALEDVEAAQTMKNVSALKLAVQQLQSGDAEAAAAALNTVDAALLPERYAEEYQTLRTALDQMDLAA